MGPVTDAPRPIHVAARLEDALQGLVGAGLRRAGWRPTVVAFPGYGLEGAWVRVLARVVLEPLRPLGPGKDARGWRRFASPSAADVPVVVEVGGERVVVRTSREGYVDVRVDADLPAGWATATLTVEGRSVGVQARLRVASGEATTGIVSDVDDTVVVTMLPRPLVAFRNAFLAREGSRRPVPGMADLYAALVAAEPDAFVVYLSTGAWNVAPALAAFLSRHRYPTGPLLLRDWGPAPTGWFGSGRDHKRRELARLLEDFPHLRWILVGDDGQHDPATYGAVAAAHPDRVRAVLLRELSLTEQVATHGGAGPIAEDVDPSDVPTLRGRDGAELLEAARAAGLA